MFLLLYKFCYVGTFEVIWVEEWRYSGDSFGARAFYSLNYVKFCILCIRVFCGALFEWFHIDCYNCHFPGAEFDKCFWLSILTVRHIFHRVGPNLFCNFTAATKTAKWMAFHEISSFQWNSVKYCSCHLFVHFLNIFEHILTTKWILLDLFARANCLYF